MGRTLVSVKQAAAHRGRSLRTIYEQIKAGFIPVYKVQGVRGVLIDIDEMDAALAQLPATRVHPKPRYGAAVVTTLTPQQAAAALPKLTDGQVTTVAALLTRAQSAPASASAHDRTITRESSRSAATDSQGSSGSTSARARKRASTR